MLDGPEVKSVLKAAGVTHVVWVPDSDLGRWDEALGRDPDLALVRVCREGEAFAVAAGLLLGGKRPVVILQCTGLFEAGDALRNVIHDMALPLFVLVGVRNQRAFRRGQSSDNCPRFTEPIVRAWGFEPCWLDEDRPGVSLAAALAGWRESNRAAVLLYAE